MCQLTWRKLANTMFHLAPSAPQSCPLPAAHNWSRGEKANVSQAPFSFFQQVKYCHFILLLICFFFSQRKSPHAFWQIFRFRPWNKYPVGIKQGASWFFHLPKVQWGLERSQIAYSLICTCWRLQITHQRKWKSYYAQVGMLVRMHMWKTTRN